MFRNLILKSFSGTMPPRRRNRDDSPPVVDSDDVNVPVRLLGSIERLFNRLATNAPNPASEFTREHARQYGAYDFSSTSELTSAIDWISRMERVFGSLGVPAARRVRMAVEFLVGDAYRWWEFVSRDFIDPSAITWAQFRMLFEDRYLSPAIRDRLRREFMSWVQGDMTVLQYEERFIMLSYYAPELVANERDKIDRFIQGLHDDYQDRMSAVEYESFRKAVDAALRCETRALMSSRGSRALEVGGPSQGPSKRLSSRSESSGGSGLGSPSVDTRSSSGRHGHGARQRFREASSRSSGASIDVPIQRTYPQCLSCGRHHLGQCQAGSRVCFQCGQHGHYRRECPQLTDRDTSAFDRDTSQASRGTSSSGASAGAAGRGNTQQGSSAQRGRPTTRSRVHAMFQREERPSHEVGIMLILFNLEVAQEWLVCVNFSLVGLE
jgi:hypothetical protein